jgi:hypothetical protein
MSYTVLSLNELYEVYSTLKALHTDLSMSYTVLSLNELDEV